MKNHSQKSPLNYALLAMLMLCLHACSKEVNTDIQTLETPEAEAVERPAISATTYIYKEKTYKVNIDKEGNPIETEESEALRELLSNQSDATSFSFGTNTQETVYIFDSEMDGYKYIEEKQDKRLGRKLQVGHATDLLRDQLIAKYGSEDLDYSNPLIYEEARKGIEAIYTEFKIVGEVPRDVEHFMGKLETNNSETNRISSIFRLWEHPNSQGEMFDLVNEPNVAAYTHGDWNCFRTYIARDLNLNFRQSGQSWNDCFSSACMSYQPGSDAAAFAFYRHPHVNSYCDKRILTAKKTEWYNGTTICMNNLFYELYSTFCGNMENNISSVRVKIIWQGCPLDFTDV